MMEFVNGKDYPIYYESHVPNHQPVLNAALLPSNFGYLHSQFTRMRSPQGDFELEKMLGKTFSDRYNVGPPSYKFVFKPQYL